MIKLSKNLQLPIDAVTQTFCILAKRGVGKTHTASVMAEEMLKAGQPIVVYDPTGAWFGLKSSKDGKKPAYPVVIFGGEHADIPLEETAGATIANVIVERRFPAVLDCSLLRKGARIRFMTDFCETLYHKNREPIHFFIDEGQTIAPQNLRAMPEAARLLGAMEDILLQGRRRGLGCTVISPRPAVLNTNIRSACEVIIAMQIIGPHDRKAISEWVDLHGDDEKKAKEMMSSISSLARGEAWVWSPAWLGIFKRVKFRDRETFDSSATPTVGGKVIGPSMMAEVNIHELGQQILETVERAKADDPKELRRKIGALMRDVDELKRQLEQRPVEAQGLEVPIEVPAFSACQMLRLEDITTELMARFQTIHEGLASIGVSMNTGQRALDEISATIRECCESVNNSQQNRRNNLHQNRQPERKPLSQNVNGRAAQIIPAKSELNRTLDGIATHGRTADSACALPKGERAILTACAQYEGGVDKSQLSILAGFKRSSRDAYLARLRGKGYISTTTGGFIVATDTGIDALGDFEPLPTGKELQSYWMQRLPEGEKAILFILINNYPQAVDREAISAATDYRRSSRDAYISRLASRKLVDITGPGMVRAADMLF